MRAKGVLLLRFAVLCGIAFIAGNSARGQFLEPPDTDFFGDDLDQSVEVRADGAGVNGGLKNPANLAGYESLLLFKDGRQLRGRLERLDKKEVTWKRPDFSDPIHLRRSDVRRVYLAPDTMNEGNPFMHGAVSRTPSAANEGPGAVVPATLKLGGNDWMQGEITSPDGQNFTVRLDKKGDSVTAPRSQVEWMFFDPNPARGGGFDGSLADAEDWLASAPSATLADDGALVIAGRNESFERLLPQPPLFEISMEISAGSEQGCDLSLEPSTTSRDTFTRRAVKVEFGPRQLSLCRFTNGMELRNFPVAEAGGEEANGMVRYHIFYDSNQQRLVVFRNGRMVADWKPEDLKPGEHPRIESIALSEGPNSRGDGKPLLKLRRFHVSPWNGILPEPGEISAPDDQLSLAAAGTIAGRLERITDKEVAFSQRSEFPRPGMFIRLAHESGAPFESAARVELADSGETGMRPFGVWSLDDWLRNQSGAGELSVSALEIRDGKAHLRTAFANDLELPESALAAISFPSPESHAPIAGGCLVFKNGDELPGALISAAHDAPLRWRISGGQIVAIDLKNVAGVLVSNPAPLKTAAKGARAELRNGDRLRGNIVSFDEHRLGLKEPLLGPLSVDHPQIWKLLPQAGAEMRDGADDPAGWMSPEANIGPFDYSPIHGRFDPKLVWLYFDGHYLPRPPNGRFEGIFLSPLLPPQRGGLFEVRAEITQPRGSFLNSIVSIIGRRNDDDSLPGSVPSISVNFSGSDVYVFDVNGPNGPKDWKFPLDQKHGQISNRMSFRIFVNSVLGTVAIMIDGTLLLQIGRQANERFPGIDYAAQFGGYNESPRPMILSNLWVGPWNGELPQAKAAGRAFTALANGDAAANVPSALKDGKYLLETEAGPVQLPAASVSAIAFGGAYAPPRAAARLRLIDGSIIHVAGFDCRDGVLSARSDVLGEFRLPLESVAEIAFDPAPLREPPGPRPKQQTQPADSKGVAAPANPQAPQ